MLSSIRKFSTSIYAKILLGIVVIPFVFWGMGSSFTSGSKNIVVIIDKEKYSTQDFTNYIQKFIPNDQKISNDQIEELLSAFIGEKLIEKEVENFGIKLSDKSLSKLIKHQEGFKRENIFSRTEYEKFLLKNNITASSFENNLKNREKKKQLLDIIGGGVLPSKFLIDASYNKINQKRDIQLINLNNVFKKKLNFSEIQIKDYYEKNKNNFKEIYKSVKIFELSPKKLTGTNEYNNLYFEKIDEIDDFIIQGENLDNIAKRFNFENINTYTFNKSGKDINAKKIDYFSETLIKNIFTLPDTETTALIEAENTFFVIEVLKTENIENKLDNINLKNSILFNLEKDTKRKLIAEIVSKINKKGFNKSDFDELSKNSGSPIQKIKLKNQNDNKILKKELVEQIYNFPEKELVVIHDIDLKKNFLIFIEKIENVTIDKKSDEFREYLNQSRFKVTSGLFNTYDNLIKKNYKIDVNYKTLDTIKNYFN